ncbi:MAG: hypothetical protein AAF449_00405 [Myxococcota bacterium]
MIGRRNQHPRLPLEGEPWFQYLRGLRPEVPLYWSCEIITPEGCRGHGVLRVPWHELDIDLTEPREDELPELALYDMPSALHCDRCGRSFVEEGLGVEHIDWLRTLEALCKNYMPI